MTESALVEFSQLDLMRDVLSRADFDRVQVEPDRVEFGDLETLDRYTLTPDGVVEWRGDRGAGRDTGTVFDDVSDAERWIVTVAAEALRARSGLGLGDWLLNRERELPAGFTAVPEGRTVLVRWTVRGEEHRARFGGALPMARAVQFATVARVPIDRIEPCALDEDSRGAFAAASLSA
ncbi:hypothetical protein [Curtobacterium sp. ZW137]|uniref:hypothetical protein n=1 Tax=Curtobacterium sp. ZW137 TaxID=2485104 RepID=UPI000F4B4538|nr:hypothetical protein [Curtobacterium sp. ZW137]ROP60360.1 hypothetical protein EDF55_3368 [Curtobacterium sp. ZW137]